MIVTFRKAHTVYSKVTDVRCGAKTSRHRAGLLNFYCPANSGSANCLRSGPPPEPLILLGRRDRSIARVIPFCFLKSSNSRSVGRGRPAQLGQRHAAGAPRHLGWSRSRTHCALHGGGDGQQAQSCDQRLLHAAADGGQSSKRGPRGLHAQTVGQRECHAQTSCPLAGRGDSNPLKPNTVVIEYADRHSTVIAAKNSTLILGICTSIS
jgi:hypothetical protein